ncbi:sulfur oxidation c-type cytochrome SoxX [Sneathiella aquimaris]|uniref:sulfur oxidation c-type cytochrome SoxX n=1 Tax=Sneathiella aquimaris TaxID=2599305 RepID=UPI002260E1CC|nr:sulfur oxidation c-type cytochrome SoxX [Sneathiella aquimaris]
MKNPTLLGTAVLAIAMTTVAITGHPQAAESVKYTIVEDAIPNPLTKEAGDPDKGRKAVINRKQGNCLACHAVTSLANQPFHGEVGPPLDGVSQRYNDGQLRLILVNSKKVFDGTIMPAFYRTDGLNRVSKKFKGKTILSAQQIEDIIAFLKTQ